MVDGEGPYQPERGLRDAVLNFRRAPAEEFGLWAEAFARAGQSLTQQLVDRGHFSDLDACPIVFMYRHALELYLKGIAVEGYRFQRICNAVDRSVQITIQKPRPSHALAPWLPALETVLHDFGDSWKGEPPAPETFDALKEMVAEIDRIDAKSMAFRYPVSVDFETSNLPQDFRFGVVEFARQVGATMEILDNVLTHLEWKLEEALDALGELRDLENEYDQENYDDWYQDADYQTDNG